MSSNVKQVNGTLVTDIDFEPPANWTNDYEEMGGEMMWSKDGEISQVVEGYGLEGDVKPLIAMASYTGEAISLFELSDGQFFLFNAIEGSLYQIKNPSDLQSIVSTIDDEDRGLPALEIEAL